MSIEKIERLLATHYRIMRTKRVWYELPWLEATKRLCVMASDLRSGIDKPRHWPARSWRWEG